jgi:hypothetical protein
MFVAAPHTCTSWGSQGTQRECAPPTRYRLPCSPWCSCTRAQFRSYVQRDRTSSGYFIDSKLAVSFLNKHKLIEIAESSATSSFFFFFSIFFSFSYPCLCGAPLPMVWHWVQRLLKSFPPFAGSPTGIFFPFPLRDILFQSAIKFSVFFLSIDRIRGKKIFFEKVAEK